MVRGGAPVRCGPLRGAVLFGAGMLVACVLGARPLAAQTAPSSCTGDCGDRGVVAVDDLTAMVNIALGGAPLSTCANGDPDQDGRITIDEIVAAVGNALHGCRLALHAAVHFDQPAGAINQQLLGTVQSAPLAEDNQLLQSAVGPPYMRLDAGFEGSGCPNDPSAGALYDAAQQTFNYCQLDQRLAEARAAGAVPLVIIDYMPPPLAAPACAASSGKGLGVERCPPQDFALYGALVTAMIMHAYGTAGVTDFEVWNEPDGTFFAGSFADYLTLYETCNAAVQQAESALGLSAGTLHLGGPAALNAHRAWITGLLADAVANPALRVDFISWHNYADNPFGPQPDPFLYAGTYADDTARVRGWAAPYETQRADLHPKLWIDEWNVNALFDARMDTAYDAAFLAASLHGMQDAGLDRAARFNTWDGSPPSGGLNGNWGLFTHDGGVRPALYAFALWRQLAPVRVAVQLLDSAAQARDAATRSRYTQNLIAARDPASGRATVLLYNFVAYSPLQGAAPYCGDGPALTATLDLDGLADGGYTVTRQQIDCTTPIQPVAGATLAASASALSVAAQHATLTVAAPPDSVVLLTLTGQP